MSQTNSFTDLKAIESSTEQIPIVGHTVLWRLHGLRVQQAALRDALDRSGFLEFLPDPPTPRKALRRALEAWVAARAQQAQATRTLQQQTDSDEVQRTLIRVINRAGSDHLVFALVTEDIDFKALGLGYATDLRILLEKKTGQMICSTNASGRIEAYHESQQVAAELQPYWQEFKDLHIAGDLSEMTRRIIDSLQATALRRNGGVYFIPKGRRDELFRLREVIADLPHGDDQPFVCAFGVPDLQETKTQMVQAIHAGMLDEIAGLRADLHRLAEDGTNVREDTVICRLATYQSIRSKAQVYADLLGLRQDAIRTEIGELEAQARRLLLHDTQPAKAKPQKSVKSETAQEKSKPAHHTEIADEIERLPLLYLNGTGHPSSFLTASQTAGD
ncbi:MAG: DUF6744 family protein [Blastocatellales bacterium]